MSSTVQAGRGVRTLPADDYHADELGLENDHVTLSASIANLLCNRSPAHARAAHPKLNPDHRREESERFDIGTAAHAILLEGTAAIEVVDAPDWRTNAAKDARDAARAAGKIPLLAHTLADVEAMVRAAAEQLVAHSAQPTLFTAGKAEQTLIWDEPGGVVCRARLDWLRDDLTAVDDLKTTSRSASPEQYSRALFNVGGDVQAAMYQRAVRALTGSDAEFRWVVIETSPPFALSVISPGPDVLELGHRKVAYAIDAWRECLASGDWPGYPQQTCYANAPAYEIERWLDRVAQEAA